MASLTRLVVAWHHSVRVIWNHFDLKPVITYWFATTITIPQQQTTTWLWLPYHDEDIDPQRVTSQPGFSPWAQPMRSAHAFLGAPGDAHAGAPLAFTCFEGAHLEAMAKTAAGLGTAAVLRCFIGCCWVKCRWGNLGNLVVRNFWLLILVIGGMFGANHLGASSKQWLGQDLSQRKKNGCSLFSLILIDYVQVLIDCWLLGFDGYGSAAVVKSSTIDELLSTTK